MLLEEAAVGVGEAEVEERGVEEMTLRHRMITSHQGSRGRMDIPVRRREVEVVVSHGDPGSGLGLRQELPRAMQQETMGKVVEGPVAMLARGAPATPVGRLHLRSRRADMRARVSGLRVGGDVRAKCFMASLAICDYGKYA